MDSVSGVGVLDKAVVVLQAVAQSPATLADLVGRTGSARGPPCTALRRRWSSTACSVVMLPVATNSASDWCRSARPPRSGSRSSNSPGPCSTTSAADTGESVQLFVREGAQRRCVVSLESPHGLRWIVPQGSVLPLDVGSAGRVLSGEASKQGWVQSVGEREAGVASVSAPVIAANGSTIAAISVSGPIERLTRQPGKRFGAAVVAAADLVSAASPTG